MWNDVRLSRRRVCPALLRGCVATTMARCFRFHPGAHAAGGRGALAMVSAAIGAGQRGRKVGVRARLLRARTRGPAKLLLQKSA
jgi:hypothetical protein